MSPPVCGFRPLLALFLRITKFPNPEILILSSCSSVSLMMSKTDSTILDTSFLGRPTFLVDALDNINLCHGCPSFSQKSLLPQFYAEDLPQTPRHSLMALVDLFIGQGPIIGSVSNSARDTFFPLWNGRSLINIKKCHFIYKRFLKGPDGIDQSAVSKVPSTTRERSRWTVGNLGKDWNCLFSFARRNSCSKSISKR